MIFDGVRNSLSFYQHTGVNRSVMQNEWQNGGVEGHVGDRRVSEWPLVCLRSSGEQTVAGPGCCGPNCPHGRGLNRQSCLRGVFPDKGRGFVCTAAHVLFCLLIPVHNARRRFPPSACAAAAQLGDNQFVPHLFLDGIHECAPPGL